MANCRLQLAARCVNVEISLAANSRVRVAGRNRIMRLCKAVCKCNYTSAVLVSRTTHASVYMYASLERSIRLIKDNSRGNRCAFITNRQLKLCDVAFPVCPCVRHTLAVAAASPHIS